MMKVPTYPRQDELDHKLKQKRNAAFSMLEIIIVIGIVGVLVGAGTYGWVSTLNASRVDSAVQIINSHLQQARQMAIAMRQDRRVAIDAGSLDGFPSNLSGLRNQRAAIWIEGRRCQEHPFSGNAFCQGAPGEPNTYQITDIGYLPDNVMIADVDGIVPGVDKDTTIFYIVFNPRGGVRNVYFEGEETSTRQMQIAAVIHLARDNEFFTINGQNKTYKNAMSDASSSSLEFGGKDELERYKVRTIEVVMLTGKTRIYDYAFMDPWPMDTEPSVTARK